MLSMSVDEAVDGDKDKLGRRGAPTNGGNSPRWVPGDNACLASNGFFSPQGTVTCWDVVFVLALFRHLGAGARARAFYIGDIWAQESCEVLCIPGYTEHMAPDPVKTLLILKGTTYYP